MAPNSEFAIKLLRALDPRSRSKSKQADLKITLEDFIKIFRNDKVSESLLNLIQSESEKRNKASQYAVPVESLPSKRIEHPSQA